VTNVTKGGASNKERRRSYTTTDTAAGTKRKTSVHQMGDPIQSRSKTDQATKLAEKKASSSNAEGQKEKRKREKEKERRRKKVEKKPSGEKEEFE
jgi:hypothetical protein